MKQVYISSLQYSMLVISSITVTGHLAITSLVFRQAGKDGWLSLLIALVPAIVCLYLTLKICEKYPTSSLAEIFQAVYGKSAKLVNLLYFCYFLIITVITFKLLIDFMTTAFMPSTPQVAVLAPFLVLSVITIYAGLEIFSRVNELMLPLLILAGITASGFSMPLKNYENLLPLIEYGLKPALWGSLPLIGLFCELVVIGMIRNNIGAKENSNSGTFTLSLISLGIIGFMFLGPLTGPIAIFGSETAYDLSFPTFNQISYIRFETFYNLQPVAIFLWVFGSFGKVSLFYYSSLKNLQSFLGLQNERQLIIPLGLIILFLALWLFPNLTVLKKFLATIYIYMGVILGIVLPGLTLLLLKVSKK